MKTGLAAATLLLLLAKAALTLADRALWPLSPYNMFSERLHADGVPLLAAELDDGTTARLYPWSVLPLDVYRSTRLLQASGERLPAVLEAARGYARAGGRGWRPAAADGRRLRALRLETRPLAEAVAR